MKSRKTCQRLNQGQENHPTLKGGSKKDGYAWEGRTMVQEAAKNVKPGNKGTRAEDAQVTQERPRRGPRAQEKTTTGHGENRGSRPAPRDEKPTRNPTSGPGSGQKEPNPGQAKQGFCVNCVYNILSRMSNYFWLRGQISVRRPQAIAQSRISGPRRAHWPPF